MFANAHIVIESKGTQRPENFNVTHYILNYDYLLDRGTLSLYGYKVGCDKSVGSNEEIGVDEKEQYLGDVPFDPDSIRLYIKDSQDKRDLFADFYKLPRNGIIDVRVDSDGRITFLSPERDSKPVHSRDLEYILPFITNPGSEEMNKLFAEFYEIPDDGVDCVLVDPSDRLIFYSADSQSKPVPPKDLVYILPIINNKEINEMVAELTTTS